MLFKRQILNAFIPPFFYIAALLGSAVAYAECGPNINEGIQKIMDDDRVKYHIPGLEVSIICPGEDSPRDFVSGTLTLHGNSPVKPHHLFQIGSETKSFIATIMLQLEAEGRLSIQDPIGKYVSMIPDAWQTITIQQVLNHTSGLFNYADVEAFWESLIVSDFKKQWTSHELIDFSVNKTPYFSPGEGWKYSNTNYVLAGMVIEAATGKLVEEELKTRLFEPLHLSNTYYLPVAYNDDILQRLAHGYYPAGSPSDEPNDATGYNMSLANTAGAMVSTSHDTAIWLRHLLTTKSVLTNAQRRKLMRRVNYIDGQPLPISSKNSGYGLGIKGGFNPSIGMGEVWGHGGKTIGYISDMYWLKCNDIVVTTAANYVGREENSILADLVQFIQTSDTKNHCENASTSKEALAFAKIR